MELNLNGKTYGITKNQKGEIWTNLHPTMKWHEPISLSYELHQIALNLLRQLRKKEYKNQTLIERYAKEYLGYFSFNFVEVA